MVKTIIFFYSALDNKDSVDIIVKYKRKIETMTKVRNTVGFTAGAAMVVKGILSWLITGIREYPVKIA